MLIERVVKAVALVCSLASQVTMGLVLNKTMKRSDFINHLVNTYQMHPPHFDDDEPTVVEVNFHINSFDSISEVSMAYVLTFFIRERWHDPQLAFGDTFNTTYLELDANVADKLWRPAGFFLNAKTGHFHEITVPNRLMRIHKDGTVLLSSRYTLTLSCAMKLERYPFDKQHCFMIYESYAYTVEKLLFVWKKKGPITIEKGLEIPQYELHEWKNHSCSKTYDDVGNFTCLKTEFILVRDRGHYVLRLYVPTVLIVMLSWVSFWINIEAVPARISLGVTTVLTIVTQASSVSTTMPRVSYVKAIDVWMTVCQAFVFAALIEYAFVNVRSRRRVFWKSIRTKKEQQAGSMDNAQETHEKSNHIGIMHAKHIDKYARIVFPLSFALFIVIYFSWYLYL